MNRIFYDSISDLPSGGGEQERRCATIVCAKCGAGVAFTWDSTSQYWRSEMSAYSDKEKFVVHNRKWTKEEIDGEVCRCYPSPQQSEIDSLKEQNQLATIEKNALLSTVNELREEIKKLREFAKSIRDGYDCDTDAHKYNNEAACRCCAAAKALLNQQPG